VDLVDEVDKVDFTRKRLAFLVHFVHKFHKFHGLRTGFRFRLPNSDSSKTGIAAKGGVWRWIAAYCKYVAELFMSNRIAYATVLSDNREDDESWDYP